MVPCTEGSNPSAPAKDLSKLDNTRKYQIFPNTLDPTSFETHTVDDEEVNVPVVRLFFKKWEGIPIANTFGGKGLIDYDGVAMFAELAIQRLALRGGWNARWVETYAMKGKIPYYFTEWGDSSLPQQIQDSIQDLTQTKLMTQIAANNDNSYSGCWDVLVWHKDRTVFIESKRNKKDSFRSTQDRWLRAGLRSGLSANNFLIALWDFI